MRALITGLTGMIGTHMADRISSEGWEVHGLARSSAASRNAETWNHNIIRCDILDRDALDDAFQRIRPELVIHLAAQAFNGTSWKMEETTHHVNYLGSTNVLRACRRFAPAARVVLACSSAAYGDVPPEALPVKEEQALRPITPYGVSKAATEALGYQYWANYSLQVYLPRLFIHVGTGHPPATAIQNFARQLALIATGRLEPRIRVGNLTTARDFIDVRDGVEGVLLMLRNGSPGQAVNICTGRAHKISDVLSMLLEISGQKVEVADDPELWRPSDEPLLVGDNTKLKAMGWRARYTLQQTLHAVYQDWLARVEHES